MQPSVPGYDMVDLDVVADREAIWDLDQWAFASALSAETIDGLAFPLEPGRTVGIRRDGELTALHASYAFRMGVPGGELPTAGLTWVGVHPGHRRKGLATAMLRTHLQRTAEREEPLSALWAAEPEIYGRFGYGAAATHVTATLERRVALREVPGADSLTCRLERLDLARHRDIVAEVMGRSNRPGRIVPSSEALIANLLFDVPEYRDGAEKKLIAIVADDSGTPLAFAFFRRKEESHGSRGVVQVTLAETLTPAAAHVLWTTLTDLDLMGTVTTPKLAPDDPLFGQLVNVRTARVTCSDNIWVRLVDLPRALCGRLYSTPVNVVLEVTDALLPSNEGRWRLESDGRGFTGVAPTTDPADIALDTRELATAYLGGASLYALGNAGLVRELTPGALAAASTAFAWPEAPVCTWIF